MLGELHEKRTVVDVNDVARDAGRAAAAVRDNNTHVLGELVRLLHGDGAAESFYATVAMQRSHEADGAGDAAWEAAYVRVRGECMPYMALEDTALLVKTFVGMWARPRWGKVRSDMYFRCTFEQLGLGQLSTAWRCDAGLRTMRCGMRTTLGMRTIRRRSLS